jgi:hypothetical protein
VHEIAFNSNDLFKPGPERAPGPLGGLPGDVAKDLHDGGDQGLFFFWEDLLIPLLDTPHFKYSNGLISREPGGQTLVPWGRFLLRMWKTVSVKGNFIKKI